MRYGFGYLILTGLPPDHIQNSSPCTYPHVAARTWPRQTWHEWFILLPFTMTFGLSGIVGETKWFFVLAKNWYFSFRSEAHTIYYGAYADIVNSAIEPELRGRPVRKVSYGTIIWFPRCGVLIKRKHPWKRLSNTNFRAQWNWRRKTLLFPQYSWAHPYFFHIFFIIERDLSHISAAFTHFLNQISLKQEPAIYRKLRGPLC